MTVCQLRPLKDRERMKTKTDLIKQMFIDEFPPNAMIKADLYQNGVSFFDSELDIDEIDRFIRTLVTA